MARMILNSTVDQRKLSAVSFSVGTTRRLFFVAGPAFRRAALIAVSAFLWTAAQGQNPEWVAEIASSVPGQQLVRASVALPRGLVKEGDTLVASEGSQSITTALRILSWHPAVEGESKSARRALVTFPYKFPSTEKIPFRFKSAVRPSGETNRFPAEIRVTEEEITIVYRDGSSFRAHLLAPARASQAAPRTERVESNAFFRWERFHFPDDAWPRMVEVRADILGRVTVVAHVQRRLPGDGRAPDLGWEIDAPVSPNRLVRTNAVNAIGSKPVTHSFKEGQTCAVWMNGDRSRLDHPTAALKRRGRVEAEMGTDDRLHYRYWRCTAEERVPMQAMAWQRAEFVLAPAELAPVSASLQSTSRIGALHRAGPQRDAIEDIRDGRDQPELAAILDYHHDAIVRSMAVGDDWGNVTGYSDGGATGSVFGMNRLNHGPPIFEEGWRREDRRLTEVAVLWCDNMFDQSIWWGSDQTGGTRYNNIIAQNRPPPEDDRTYMWRSNGSVNFCTKGYDAFFLAYEETGDPRMIEALEAQIQYAAQNLHVDRGECRNIGDVRDFVRLYEFTGRANYLAEALRLFRELRTKLSPGDLFSQGGQPIVPDPPFIDDDATGTRHPFAKPYIIGYALAGLPELARWAPREPKLREVIQAVADFLAQSQDPVGGWRYPHPHSSYVIMSQAIEHAWQLVQADRFLGPQEAHLDAIERALRQRVLGWMRTGRIFSGLGAWEMAAGRVQQRAEIGRLYAKAADRDRERDYSEGLPEFGSSAPEGLVYFPEVLAFYLKHRPASRLLTLPRSNEPLGQVLARVKEEPPESARRRVAERSAFQTSGVQNHLPAFREAAAERLTFPMSWLSGNHRDFAQWREAARAQVRECLLSPPPAAPFDPVILAEQDRGAYVARKVVFNLTRDSRVLGSMLVPKGAGPFPAVLLLHDHGARFDIGKEKVIEPWEDRPERLKSAREWVDRYYGGRFIGDELARRGFVCLATDALNWSDRGGGGYEGQQALAGNLLHLGMSFAGVIAWEDLRAAEFLATRPEVDGGRVAAMGLSMGSFRAWQVAALSDHIAAGVAVCWLATAKGLMVPGNNQTRGQSAFTMTHPGLSRYLDYADVASLACPKPMLFYNGEQDALFPVFAVREAYAKLRGVWESQAAGDRLETRLWNVPHVFNREMQEAAFAWLERWSKKGNGR